MLRDHPLVYWNLLRVVSPAVPTQSLTWLASTLQSSWEKCRRYNCAQGSNKMWVNWRCIIGTGVNSDVSQLSTCGQITQNTLIPGLNKAQMWHDLRLWYFYLRTKIHQFWKVYREQKIVEEALRPINAAQQQLAEAWLSSDMFSPEAIKYTRWISPSNTNSC